MRFIFSVTILSAILFTHSANALNPALEGVYTGKPNIAPAELNFESYKKWVQPIVVSDMEHDYFSAFTEKAFAWYEREKNRDLPAEVGRDREKIYVDVESAKRQTIEMEDAGEIEEYNTVGAEVYAEMAGSVAQVLETTLFRWGKPVAKTEGSTNPPGGQFAKRVEYFAPNLDWGSGAFANMTQRTNGGIVKDLFDRYIVLVRGDEQHGYDVLMQFLRPANDRTSTKKSLGLAIIRPLDANRTSFKIITRYQGQSYSFLGGIGRGSIGFNATKVRAVQQESNKMLKELRDTGTIK
jgi:hypothetical protein